MKRFLIVLLGSFCGLFCRMFPANALNPSECPTQVQQCTNQNKAPKPGPTGVSGGVACSGIQCVATGSSAVGTGYTVDGSNCTVCATNICNTGSGAKCQLKAGLDNSWDKYLCSSYSCIKSGSGSSGSTMCSMGQYLSGGKCVDCPNGLSTTVTGATSVSQCNACKPGYYSTGPSGTGTGAVPSGTITCTQCAIGFYKSGIGNTQCTACPSGQTTSGTGSTSTGDCYTNKSCQAGYFYSGSGCVTCFGGFYKSDVGEGPCTRCPTEGLLTGTSSTGATSETLCFVPGGAITGTDTNGQYTYDDPQCFYKS